MPRAAGKSTALTAKKGKKKEKVVLDEDLDFKKQQAAKAKAEKEARDKLLGKGSGKK